MNESPAGRAGEIDHVVTGPPALDGTSAVIATPVVSERVDDEYEMFGTLRAALTVMLITNVDDPAELVAVTVWFVAAAVAVGVPEIWPVFELNDSPAGRAGETDHEAAGDPEFVGSSDAMAELTT